MRNFIIVTIVAIIGSILAYGFSGDLAEPDQHSVEIAKAQTDMSSVADINDKLDQLTNAFQQFQQTYYEQLKHTHAEQARLDNELINLDNKLEPVETITSDASENDPISTEDTKIVEFGKFGEVAEQNLGHWMNETLQNESWDIDTTTQINEQASKTLTELPGVSIDDIQCSERFCRATLSHESGEQPDVSNLMGKPPFTNDGFTVHEEDGRVTFYFTGAGVSLGDLQSEAQLAIH